MCSTRARMTAAIVCWCERGRSRIARRPKRPCARSARSKRPLTRPPTAELRPGQTDQDSLPPYDVLDPILRFYVEEDRSAKEIIELGYDAEVVHHVLQLVDRAEYKRQQAAPGLKISPKAFGYGRRFPIAAKSEA